MGRATVLSSIVNDKLGLTTFMGERLADEYELIPRDVFSKNPEKYCEKISAVLKRVWSYLDMNFYAENINLFLELYFHPLKLMKIWGSLVVKRLTMNYSTPYQILKSYQQSRRDMITSINHISKNEGLELVILQVG